MNQKIVDFANCDARGLVVEDDEDGDSIFCYSFRNLLFYLDMISANWLF